MQTIQVKKIEKQAAQIERQNPSIEDPGYLSKLVLDGKISEQLIAYFTEIKNNKHRDLSYIQKLSDEITTRSRPIQKIYHVKLPDTHRKNRDSDIFYRIQT